MMDLSKHNAIDIIDLEEQDMEFRNDINKTLRAKMLDLLMGSGCGASVDELLKHIFGYIESTVRPEIVVNVDDEYKRLKYWWFEKTYRDITKIAMNECLPF